MKSQRKEYKYNPQRTKMNRNYSRVKNGNNGWSRPVKITQL